MEKYLIVGLGNPGKQYEETRHSIGWQIASDFASQNGMSFSESKKFQAKVATGEFKGKKTYVLLPLTYMNLSGIAVRLCLQFYRIDISNVLVIADDVAIPFGQFRFKRDSGSGGQKGIQNIIEELKTNAFPRMRVGIGEKTRGDLSGHVLGKFTQEEKQFLPTIRDKSVEFIELWIDKGMQEVMNRANLRSGCLEVEQNKGNGE